ncbi:2-C-methyl-D-erythritol 4-phosphate cytidylyltransferase [Alteromonas sp. ASW11-130]|uniref:2-C-methyl-D-erythritol 4-phosphate cytidylyltransferase n=1 Tax=Alteromonas sp. ASW11-130 TaxID=3015775 RepID=UPI002241A1BC|nr:2-C-methyl-D-erythritol 4-phosphate cytidylyltransferase [Alteromonas sp. ASW11-130]MCW8091885.1 2-C-methyl-D-erythritol 4-phosphate cytidylyltransferase [Alteromonas sp. ASW11-130]
MNLNLSVTAVVPAAGVGSRMQAGKPKQYLNVAGKTILEHTLHALMSHPLINHIIVAANPDDDILPTLPFYKKSWLTVVEGGTERAQSVLNAVKTLPETSWALVHDAARPCLCTEDIGKLLSLINDDSIAGGILATPVRDTMKRAHPTKTQIISHTESRESLWHALTPQLFRAGELTHAIQVGLTSGTTITDEASAMEAVGHQVKLVAGNPANIKITHPEDLPLAEFYLSQRANTNKE